MFWVLILGVYFRTFGVGGSFSDVRGSDVRGAFFGRSGFIFGRSGFGVHFRTFGVRTLGGAFSDVRGSDFIFGRSGLGVRSSMEHGLFSDIRGSYVRGSTPNIRKSKTPKTPNV